MHSSATSASAIPFNNAYSQSFQQQHSQPPQYWPGSGNGEIPSTSTANNGEGFPVANMPQQQFNQLNQPMSNEHAFFHQRQMHIRMMQGMGEGPTPIFNGENGAQPNGFNEAPNTSVNQNNAENLSNQQHQSVADIMASINIQQQQQQQQNQQNQISTPSPGLSSVSPHLRIPQHPSSVAAAATMGVPQGMVYSPQMNFQNAGTPNGFPQAQYMNAMQQAGRMPPHMMPNGQMIPNSNGFNNGAGSIKSAYVFDSDMANRASAEVAQKKFDSMASWHIAHINPTPSWPTMTPNNWIPNSIPSTSTASMPSMNMMMGQMNGVGSDMMPVGSPRTRTPNGTTARGIKRRATPALDQQHSVTTPSPHLSQENMSQQQSNPNSIADHLLIQQQQQMMAPNGNDFLRPGSSHIKPSDSSGYGTNFKTLEDNPLKKIEQMTKLCDSPISHKIARTCPTTESEPKSKEQKLAKLNEIQQSLEGRSYPSVSMNGPGVPPGMRPPPNFYGPPGTHLPPGLGVPPGQVIDPHLAAMFRQQQQQAMYQQQLQQMNAYGGIPQHLRGMPQQSQQQPSPSFTGLPSGGGPQAGAAVAASMQQQQWSNMMQMNGHGHPAGFENEPHNSAMDMQNNMLRGGPPNGTVGPNGGCDANFPAQNCWPPQHQMPQPLANLDARVPIQKMQYFANNITPSSTPQQQ